MANAVPREFDGVTFPKRLPMARTYNQDCILALALDILGERWTMLILRDLFLGPQRFGDLQAGLPGIGANLLSKRLKELDQAGIIISPGPTESGAGYRLSAVGEGLRPAIREMMAWSIKYFMLRPDSSPARDCIYADDLEPDSVALTIELFANHRPESDLNYVAHIHIDDFPYTFYYMNGEMVARRGADTPAVSTLSTDVGTIMKAFRAEFTMDEVTSKITCTGDENVITHLLDCFVHTKTELDEKFSLMKSA